MALFVLAVPSLAAVLTWQGDAGTGWNDGTVASNTNWTDGTASPTDQRKPAAGDVLVFNTGGIYSGDLTLGGAAVDVDGITIGDGVDHLGQADFGVLQRILGSNGKIRLGAGGLAASMLRDTAEGPDATPNEARNIQFNTDIELTTSTTIRRLGNFGAGARARQLVINGVISGGTRDNPVNLVIENAGQGSANKGVYFTRSNTFIGELTVHGTLLLDKADGFGDPMNLVRIGTGVYLQMFEAGNVTTWNSFVLPTDSTPLINRAGGSDWTLAGNITGGAAGVALDLLGGSGRRIIFAGSEQSFSNRVDMRTGTRVVIAAADSSGVAWPNAGRIRMNYTTYNDTMAHLLLRGSFSLKQAIEIGNTASTSAKTMIGELNDGPNPFAALFEGNVDCQEPDFAALQLTADAGGRATFNGKIRIAGGTYGFEKLGAGTVVVNNRVSQAVANTLPVGQVKVSQGTLLVNSPASDPFSTTSILVSDGASFGGSGKILGSVTLTGTTAATLAPGGDLGPLVIDGNVDFDNAGVLAVTWDASGSNRLDVNGLLDLSATDDRLVITAPNGLPGGVGLIASYDSLTGTFDNVDLSALGSGYQIDYHYLGQNQIALVAPEPSSVFLAVVGLLACLVSRKGRRPWSLWGRRGTRTHL